MVVFRALGWLLLAMAVAAIVHDGLAWWTEGSFHLLGLGDLWAHLDTRSLADAQTAVQRRVWRDNQDESGASIRMRRSGRMSDDCRWPRDLQVD